MPAPSPLRALTAPARTLAGRLTRALIMVVSAVWLACMLGVLWYVDREINANFDSELVEVSHRLFDLALARNQPGAVTPDENPAAAQNVVIAPPLFVQDEVRFRIVDSNARVLMRSPHADAQLFDIALAPGFANTTDWRIYTVRHPSQSLFLQVADPLSEREQATQRTLLGLLVPMLAVLPLLAWLVMRTARRELRVLNDLAAQLQTRSGSDLQPIAVHAAAHRQALPAEIQSLVEDVNRLLERLAHALDVERALAANAAHELRTPLATARLRLQTALDQNLQQEDVEAALVALKALSHRTEKLLQLSRAESAAALARQPVDLVQLAAAVADEFWQDEAEQGRLSLSVPDTALPRARGDVDALAIALRNLIENALRYAAPARVELAVEPPCTLRVRDHGPGVPPERLLDMQQRHVRHSDARAGYGLGLSIVATIVAQHGATLLLQSPPERGGTGLEARIVLEPYGE